MGSTVFPRRLTQLFADTKKSYEHVVQTRQNAPEAASLHLKLRIQKDRLIAWGIQWSDRSTASQAGDIDGSLDRAGISDLVASIMCNIRDLLDEAEGLQPIKSLDLPESYGELKVYGKSVQEPSWTPTSLTRLEEILKDLTTSIDTLCDLSRPRNEATRPSELVESKAPEKHDSGTSDVGLSAHSPPSQKSVAASSSSSSSKSNPSTLRAAGDSTGLAYVATSRLRLRRLSNHPGSAPPSYESVATDSEHRAFAYLSGLRRQSTTGQASLNQHGEVPVLLDYGQPSKGRKTHQMNQDLDRFEELSFTLSEILQEAVNPYQGLLRLEGWTLDEENARCAYVHEVPTLHRSLKAQDDDLQPRTLLSFLQNGGDTDSNNIPSLENRFRLALNVASSVALLHGKGVTHRNVNSGNVVFFVSGQLLSSTERVWKGPVIRMPYLTAFHQSSSKLSHSANDPVLSGIYQHHSLGDGQSTHYEHAHDLYSLGLILLEIGLWMPIGKFWKSKYTRRDFKARLQDIYLRKLSGKCGDGYMNVVLYCMTAADGIYPIGPTDSVQAPSETDTNMDVVRAVINPLKQCCLIDDSRTLELSASTSTLQLNAEETARQRSSANEQKQHEKGIQVSSPIDEVQGSSSTKPDPQIGEDKVLSKSQESVASCRKIKVWSHELPALYSKYWGATMFPKLERILSRAVSRWESYTIDLFMAGEDADTARPTVYMECKNTAKVRKILRHLNKELRLFDIKVVSGQIVRSKAGKKKNRKNTQKKKVSASSTLQYLNPHYQQKPVCGASIGAYHNGTHLPAVSFGGAVLVDDEAYGMSVHHLLEEDEEVELGLEDASGLLRSMAPRSAGKAPQFPDQYQGLYPFEVSEPAEVPDDSSLGCSFSASSSSADMEGGFLPEAIYPFEISEDELNGDTHVADDDDEFWLSPDFDNEPAPNFGDEDDFGELGDTVGVQVGCGEDLIVTQPAFDDVNREFFPSEEDMDEDHVSSHKLGHIHASSGIKRTRRDQIIHEVDWALIKINEQRLQARNVVQGGSQHCKSSSAEGSCTEHSYPSKVMKANDLGGLQVHACGRTSGLQTGQILPAMRLVRMPGRSFASHSWQVRGNFGGRSLNPPNPVNIPTPVTPYHFHQLPAAPSSVHSFPKHQLILLQKAATPVLGSSTTPPAISAATSSPIPPLAPSPTSPQWKSSSTTWPLPSAQPSPFRIPLPHLSTPFHTCPLVPLPLSPVSSSPGSRPRGPLPWAWQRRYRS